MGAVVGCVLQPGGDRGVGEHLLPTRGSVDGSERGPARRACRVVAVSPRTPSFDDLGADDGPTRNSCRRVLHGDSVSGAGSSRERVLGAACGNDLGASAVTDVCYPCSGAGRGGIAAVDCLGGRGVAQSTRAASGSRLCELDPDPNIDIEESPNI